MTQPTEPSPSPSEAPQKKRDTTVLFWSLGILPICLAALHLVVVSRGNAQTLRALVENLNVTALVLSTVLPLLSTAVTWMFFLVLLMSFAQHQEAKWTRVGIFFLLVVVVDVFAMNLKYLAINLGLFVGIILVMVAAAGVATVRPTWNERLRAWTNQFGRWIGAGLLLGPVVIWLGFLGVWMPQERLTIGSTEVSPVYVLSSDIRWTKYMDADHAVHLVPTQQVSHRQMIGASDSNWYKTPFALWRGSTVGEVPDPQVPPTATPTVVQAPPVTVTVTAPAPAQNPPPR